VSRRCVVAVNAHPDDEAILMGGTLARLSAEGHRVVLVTATDGDAGPSCAEYAVGGLGARRLLELRASALALGAAEVIDLGYGDSGMGPESLRPCGGRARLHTVDVAEAATRVGAIFHEQQADVVIGCDEAGGYGHRDHVQVHRIVRRAVHDLPHVRLFEATVPREPILRAVRIGHRMHLLGDFDPDEWAGAFTPSASITHRVDVRDHIHAKRAAMAAHQSQATSAGGRSRSLALTLSVPTPLLRHAVGREFFVEPRRTTSPPAPADAFNDIVHSGTVSSPQKGQHE